MATQTHICSVLSFSPGMTAQQANTSPVVQKKKGRVESYGIGFSCDDKGSYMLHVVAVMLMTLQIMMEL